MVSCVLDEYVVLNGSCVISRTTDSNNATRYLAYWEVGTSMEVGINLGLLDIVVSAPVKYMTGISRGLLGKSYKPSKIIMYIHLHTQTTQSWFVIIYVFLSCGRHMSPFISIHQHIYKNNTYNDQRIITIYKGHLQEFYVLS